jgi:hypothetical protein
MSKSRRQAIAVAVIIIWIAMGYLFASEPQIFDTGETQSTLIELFTSEGCSSCPPAEKWLSSLKSNQNLWKKIVPIAFHVDYWDHLGWRDRFARPQFTSRQQHYAATWGGDSVYTPGFVVNGKEWRDWLGGNVTPTSSTKVGVLRLSLGGDGRVGATFVPDKTQQQGFALHVALLGTDLESDVKRGENSGRKLRHDFVALDLIQANMTNESNRWTGLIALPTRTGNDKPSAFAAWITENGIPVQATGGWLQR